MVYTHGAMYSRSDLHTERPTYGDLYMEPYTRSDVYTETYKLYKRTIHTEKPMYTQGIYTQSIHTE